MPQFFRLLNTKEEHTLLARGEETTTPQVARASNSCVLGVHDFPLISLWSVDFKCVKWCKNL
jgi:hypothetical protein